MKVYEKMKYKPLGLNVSTLPTHHCYWPCRFSVLLIKIFFCETIKVTAINHFARRQALSGVLKTSLLKALGILYFPAFSGEGLNAPYGSKALKEQVTERTPLDACLNNFFVFLLVNFYHFWFLILSLVAERLERLIGNNAY